ncbi:MAG: gliding motility protein GldC [Weeksellaceae bacterium]|nr:gliding motility protein GldC [Weeksellaceae bacterium]
MKKSQILVDIGLDENMVPEELHWTAEDGGVQKQATKAVFLTVWDDDAKEALRIDLWTKDMTMDDMKVFFMQTIHSMANTYSRATNDEDTVQKMQAFAKEFAISSGLIEE